MKITLTELQRECRLDFVKAERVLKFLEQKKIDELDSQANRDETLVMPMPKVKSLLGMIYSEIVEEPHEARTIYNIRKIFERETEPYKIKLFKEHSA